MLGWMRRRSGSTTPFSMHRSRRTGPSPMMLPSAHTACSHTFSTDEESSWMKTSTAPKDTTACVWDEVPDAMLVRAQAASNWSRS